MFENNIIADCNIGRAASLTPYVEPARDIVFRRNILFGEFPKLYDVRQAQGIMSRQKFTARWTTTWPIPTTAIWRPTASMAGTPTRSALIPFLI